MPPMRHVCTTEGSQSGASDISDVLAQVGEEATEDVCCGYIGMEGEGLLGVWDTDEGSSFAQVLGENTIVLQWRLAIGATEPMTGAGEMETTGGALGDYGDDSRTSGRRMW